MKRVTEWIVLVMILVLLSACTQTPTPQATAIKPTITVELTQAPQSAATPAATTESTVVGPPAPTVDTSPSEYDLRCSTTSLEARQALSDAISLQELGQLAEAEKSYMQAIGLDPSFCGAIDNFGQLLRLQDRLDEAIAWYDKSLALYPENTVALSNLGVIYQKQGNLSQAIEAYTRVTQITPNDPEGYYGLGRIYYAMNEYAVAISHFTKAEELYTTIGSPYVVDAQYYLGLCHFALEDYVLARNYLVGLYDMAQNDGDWNYILGICYLRGEPQDLEMAGQFFLKAQTLNVVIPDEILAAMDAAAK